MMDERNYNFYNNPITGLDVGNEFLIKLEFCNYNL